MLNSGFFNYILNFFNYILNNIYFNYTYVFDLFFINIYKFNKPLNYNIYRNFFFFKKNYYLSNIDNI